MQCRPVMKLPVVQNFSRDNSRPQRPATSPASSAVFRASVFFVPAATRPAGTKNTDNGMVRAPMPSERLANSLSGSNRERRAASNSARWAGAFAYMSSMFTLTGTTSVLDGLLYA